MTTSRSRLTSTRSAPTWRRTGVVGLVASAALLPGMAQQPAEAEVSKLKGSAYGVYVKVGLFGGAPNQVGAAPVVTLPASGAKQTKTLPSEIAQFGPATIFGGQYQDPGRNPSGPLKASTEGKTGPGGFVTSAASVVNVGPGPLIADELSSTCTAKEGSVTGSTTVTKGIVETSYDPETQEAVTTKSIPEKPAPNTSVEGTIDHVGDRFRVVFNEQVMDGGTLTVRAVHLYLLGNIAVGDMIIGESVCGITAVAAAPVPPSPQAPSPEPPVSPSAPPPSPSPEPTIEPTVEPTSSAPSPDPSPTPELKAEPASSGTGLSGGALLLGGLAAAAALAGAGFLALRRRGQSPL